MLELDAEEEKENQREIEQRFKPLLSWLKIQVNNAGLVHLQTYFTPSGCFFKMGNYNQGGEEADIHVFGLVVTH